MKKSPIATKGIAFVEFSGSRPELLRAIFTQMGLAQYGHKSLERTLHHTGDIYFISNPCKGGNAERFREHHGRGVSAIGFLVDDSAAALAQALDLGAEVVQQADYTIPAIKGVGESLIYLVDDNDRKNILAEFGLQSLATEVYNHLLRVDHLTHNLHSGGIARMKEFYSRLFGFDSVRHFDIEGKKTGLYSEVIASPCGRIIIPLNETKDDKSQIAEFIREYNGEGVQHIALLTNDIFKTVEKLTSKGVEFQSTPDTYYELIDARLPGHSEDVLALKKQQILIDGGERQGGGFLLQIFTKNSIGPIFFEYIQRKGNRGFGEGNFQALFESIELDQERRGVL
jgi:4-hydroxyphenylpyruvate dioxygenase